MVLTRQHLRRFLFGVACLFGLTTSVAAQDGVADYDSIDWKKAEFVSLEEESTFVTLDDGVFEESADIEFVAFPREEAPLPAHVIEGIAHLLEKPVKPMAHLFGKVIRGEHVEPHSALDEHAIGIQPIPERPPLLLEWNEQFVAPGWLNQGVELPTGAVWRPSFWVWGNFRTAIQTFEGNRAGDPAVDWANRLDLFGQLNLSGTERVVIGLRPLDEERATGRLTTGYDLRSGDHLDGWNADFQTAFFEGDFGELFPNLDPYDVRGLDYGFSFGRMPLLAQQGLLIAEDRIDAVTVTKNTLSGPLSLNSRYTGVYSWDSIHRNSALAGRPNRFDNNSQMFALLTEHDLAHHTVNLDAAYVTSNDAFFGDVMTVGASTIQRHHGYENTYNTSAHILASWATDGDTDYAQQGELLFLQTSWTPHHTNDLVFLNTFWAIDEFTSPSRGPFNGSALGLTGILFSAPGIGRSGAPIGVQTDDVAGASLGYQMFFDETRQQVIWEIGGFRRTKDPDQRGQFGTALRWQKAMGQHFVFTMDGFVSKLEGSPVFHGARTELQIVF